MKILLLANPVAGKGRGGRAAARLVRRLEDRGHEVRTAFTTGPGDAGRCLRELGAGAAAADDRIVVVGGDGTLNEVVNALADPARVPLVQLAVGTANMLARDLGLPRRPAAVARLLETGTVRRIDLGRIGRERFAMNVSCGFDAMVVEEIRARRRGTLGFRGYLVPIARSLRRYREPRLAVSLDGGAPRSAALVLVSNLRNYGGLFSITANARCDSGRFEVCLFARARRRDLVRYALGGLLRRVGRLSGVETVGAGRVRIESAEPVAVQVDGDARGTTPVEIRVEPGALAMVVPTGGRRSPRGVPKRPQASENGGSGRPGRRVGERHPESDPRIPSMSDHRDG